MTVVSNSSLSQMNSNKYLLIQLAGWKFSKAHITSFEQFSLLCYWSQILNFCFSDEQGTLRYLDLNELPGQAQAMITYLSIAYQQPLEWFVIYSTALCCLDILRVCRRRVSVLLKASGQGPFPMQQVSNKETKKQ